MGSCFHRFILNLSEIAEPVIAQTWKHAWFKWSDECQHTFEYLKQSLTVVPLLAYPYPYKCYFLYTDASKSCIGMCLTQPCEEEENSLPNVNNEKPIY